MSDTATHEAPTKAPFDRRTALATIMLAREYIRDHTPVDWDDDRSAQEVIAEFLAELRIKVVTSEHWKQRLIDLVAEEKR